MRVSRALVWVVIVAATAGCARHQDTSITPTPSTTASPAPEPIDVTGLPVADPWAVLAAAPADPSPSTPPSGDVAQPVDEAGVALFDAPDGSIFAALPQQSYQGISAYPIVDQEGDWLQVMIPARRGLPSEGGPEGVNAATGWVRASDVVVTHLDERIEVNLAAGTVSLVVDGQVTDTVTTGYGTPETPTPTERTFVMSIAANPEATYSPVFVYLGAHSPTLDTFEGGPAPIAIHAYKSHEGPISNGCLRVAPDDLDLFSSVPLGTPVLFVG